jgi:hypothetical protein
MHSGKDRSLEEHDSAMYLGFAHDPALSKQVSGHALTHECNLAEHIPILPSAVPHTSIPGLPFIKQPLCRPCP